MKRLEYLLLGLLVILSISGIYGLSTQYKMPVAMATDFGAPVGKNVDVNFLPENGYTILTANTAGFTGSSNDIGFTTNKFTVTIVWGGTAATTTTTKLWGSIDNSTFATLVTHVSSASGEMYHVADKSVRYVKGEFTSKTGGDATSVVTMKIWAGGN
jgi:hypothetical protein